MIRFMKYDSFLLIYKQKYGKYMIAFINHYEIIHFKLKIIDYKK
jgi:hypothetical protein